MCPYLTLPRYARVPPSPPRRAERARVRWSGRALLMLGAGLSLVGCGSLDPYEKPYVWHPTGANEANLAAMVANPHDLLIGRGVGITDAAPRVLAIERVLQDQPKPLQGNGGGQNGGAAAGPAAGGSGGSASGAQTGG